MSLEEPGAWSAQSGDNPTLWKTNVTSKLIKHNSYVFFFLFLQSKRQQLNEAKYYCLSSDNLHCLLFSDRFTVSHH